MLEYKMHITPDDYIHVLHDDIAEDRLYIQAMGRDQSNEVSDYIVRKDGVVGNHEHIYGYELFIVDSGSVDAVVAGKRCMMYEGDFLLVPPHVPHSFVYKEEGTIWRELFTDMDMYGNMMNFDRLAQNCPERLKDKAYMDKVELASGTINLPECYPDPVEPNQMPFLVKKGEQVKQYQFPGITCNLKYGRWDLGGVKEIWELVLEKGMRFSWEEPHPDWDLFVVREGSVKVEVQGRDSFIAKPRDIINIPPYTVHSITALEENTILHDYNCRTKVMRVVEDFEILTVRRPHELEQPGKAEEILRKHGCPATSFGKVTVS